MQKNITLVGPVEPTGMSWLINCLLELNIKCSIDEETWEPNGVESKLNPSKSHLRRWLPVIQNLDKTFKFQKDYAISWSHDWLADKHLNNKIIFFSRDPKTALYSGYKRLGKTNLSFIDYLLEFDPKWLLNRMQIWNLFHVIWTSHPNIRFFFFEDYKENPSMTLKSVLEWIEISGVNDVDVNQAIDSSTWERAKLAEDAYLKEFGVDSPPMNRMGSKLIENELIEKEAYDLIERECNPINSRIRKGSLTDSFDESRILTSHVIELLRNNRNSTSVISANKKIEFQFTGIANLKESSFQIARRNNSETHLIASAQRQIVRNFKHDQDIIFQIKYGSGQSSQFKFCILLLWTAVGIIAGRFQRHLRRGNPN